MTDALIAVGYVVVFTLAVALPVLCVMTFLDRWWRR